MRCAHAVQRVYVRPCPPVEVVMVNGNIRRSGWKIGSSLTGPLDRSTQQFWDRHVPAWSSLVLADAVIPPLGCAIGSGEVEKVKVYWLPLLSMQRDDSGRKHPLWTPRHAFHAPRPASEESNCRSGRRGDLAWSGLVAVSMQLNSPSMPVGLAPDPPEHISRVYQCPLGLGNV